MKRIAIILSVLLVAGLCSIWTIYTLRKNKIKDQYVSESSTRIVSIAVDDLLLDNISSLLPWQENKLTGQQRTDGWIKKIIFNAGIEIPARIHLFNTETNQNQFYSILSIKNYADCFSFFAEQYPQGINFIDKEKGIVSVTINKYVNLLFNHSNIILKIAMGNNSDFRDLQSILRHPNTWSKIDSLDGFNDIVSNKHISYVQKDGKLTIEGMVTNHKTKINGKWLLSQNVNDDFSIRDMDSLDQTLVFWNLLPLSEIPALSLLLNQYTQLNPEQLNSNYFDLQIFKDDTLQKDSVISYVYDEDFNVTEEIKTQEMIVPSIIHSWRYDETLEKSLPNEMFYKFQKKRIDTYLLNTTRTTFPDQATSKKTAHPLYFSANFETWSNAWNMSILDKLKEKKVKATVSTTLQNKNEIKISGEISY